MSYLPTWIVVVVGLSVLCWVLVRVLRHVRRFNRVAASTGTYLDHETGTLRARSAAMRVAMRQTLARVKRAPADVPSNSRGRQEDDRG
ncbi:bacteriophage holin [Actinophytocola sp.]|uniref:bacteriophage holin n=1 Tax=Actinophytocola sp. TaxID=1872138 RepID=UPI003C7671D6